MEVLDQIRPKEAAFIDAQHMFFVATAPLSAQGHVNLSPKGLASFARLDTPSVSRTSISEAVGSRPTLTCERTAASV